TSTRRWRSPAIQWSGNSSHSASARASEAIRHSRPFWNRRLVCNAKSEPEKYGRPFAPAAKPACFQPIAKNCPAPPPSNVLGAGANKSYAITTSLMRIGLLTAQIAVSPSAAAQTMPANASQQLKRQQEFLALL